MGSVTQEKSNQAAQFVNEKIDQAKVGEKNFDAEKTFNDVSAKAKDLYNNGVQKASEAYGYSVDKLEETIKTRPILALAAAFAAGIATVALTRSLMAKKETR